MPYLKIGVRLSPPCIDPEVPDTSAGEMHDGRLHRKGRESVKKSLVEIPEVPPGAANPARKLALGQDADLGELKRRTRIEERKAKHITTDVNRLGICSKVRIVARVASIEGGVQGIN